MNSMKKYPIIRIAAVAASLIIALSACSSGKTAGGGSSSTGQVEITVGYQPPADQKASRAQFDRQVAQFEAANPNIKVKPETTVYDPQQFQTLLAGGTLPIVMQAPFTEPPALIQKGQIADITDQVASLGLSNTVNPTTLQLVTSKNRIYGIPVFAYSMGLLYNRDLFTQAGLDPNKPPTTWDEVRSYAKIIKDKTGAAGYAVLGANKCGGWIFSSMLDAFGGRLVSQDGTKATFADGDAGYQALKYIQDLKWVDQVMPQQNLYDCDNVNPDFAAGKIAMSMKADYVQLTQQYGMSRDAIGQGAIPQYNNVPTASLAGGAVAIVSPKATAEQKAAAVKYIQYMYLQKYLDQNTAVTEAKASSADGAPAEVPGLPVVSQAQYDTYLNWIKPYNNVPIDHFQNYLNSIPNVALVPEPKYQAQQIYAELDAVIQAVLTDQNTDIRQRLSQAQDRVNALLAKQK